MRTAARAIVVKDGSLLLMHRNKFGHEYYSLIGGGVGPGETPEQTLYREVAEEASLSITNHRLVIVEDAGSMYGIQYIYLCDYAGGEVALGSDTIEAQINAAGVNLFTPLWVPITDLPNTKLMPRELKEAVIEGLAKGFPAEPLMIEIQD
jgi:8-oxo-dGTP diphosphatase